MDLSALSKLVVFGEEISRRLIAFSKKIDEAPSSIRSIGFEIRSTCNVLNELHEVLKRQQNERTSSISSDALEEMQEAFDKCDEIIYEVGQGVLVAHERLGLVPLIDDMLVLSIQERILWPLLRPRLYSLISDLSEAKMDVVVHLLVLQVRSERFYGKGMEMSIFGSLTTDQREEAIAQLWHNKIMRDPEPVTPNSEASLNGAGTMSPCGSGTQSLQRLAEESSESEASDADTSSDCSEKRGRSIFHHLASRLSGKKPLPNSGPSSGRKSTTSRHTSGSRPHSQRPRLARSCSSSAMSSSEHSSYSSTAKSWNSSSSATSSNSQSSSYQPQNFKRPSLLSITNPITTTSEGITQRVKKVSLEHGPTMSAKRGIDLTWATLKSKGEWDEDTGPEERRLGQQLLLTQLSSQGFLPRRENLPTTAIVDMLVMRWTTSPRHRRDSIVGVAQTSSLPIQSTFYSGGGDAASTEEQVDVSTFG